MIKILILPENLVQLVRNIAAAALCLLSTIAVNDAKAAFVPIIGGPEYELATESGYQNLFLSTVAIPPQSFVNNAGTAVSGANKIEAGTSIGIRAVQTDAFNGASTELGNLATDSTGYTDSRAFGINEGGVSVGYAKLYAGDIVLARSSSGIGGADFVRDFVHDFGLSFWSRRRG